MGQRLYTKSTYLIEEVNASGSFTAPLAVCSDPHQAVAWAYVRRSEFFPQITDINGQLLRSPQEWVDNIVAGVYIVPQFGFDPDGQPMQIRVRMIEELTLS